MTRSSRSRDAVRLSSAALPFPIDDPVYGLAPAAASRYTLGNLAVRGESGALVVGLGTFARLRSNPFFAVIEANVVAGMQSPPGAN